MKKRAGTKSGADRAAAAIAAVVLIAAALGHLGWLAPAGATPEGFACTASASADDPAGCGGLAALALGGRLDLNRVGVADLDLVPGIGLRTARKIVAVRARVGRFASAEDAVTAADISGGAAAALHQWTEARP